MIKLILQEEKQREKYSLYQCYCLVLGLYISSSLKTYFNNFLAQKSRGCLWVIQILASEWMGEWVWFLKKKFSE